jgi:hypothetical protein
MAFINEKSMHATTTSLLAKNATILSENEEIGRLLS